VKEEQRLQRKKTMIRRKKTQKKALSPKHKEEKNFRFSVSLIILTAVLEMSLFILLLTLINGQTMKKDGGSSFAAAASIKKAKPVSASQDLSDAGLNFRLVIPSQLSDWKYKIGNVKSPVDDKLSDQYLRIYLPEDGAKNSRNFDKANKDFLTILNFSSGEWTKLEKGCEKGNLVFCEAMGKKIAEKDGSVYAYNKASGCSNSNSESKCNLIDKIIGSFQLK
jgi:hypothetical protein